jgi:cytochrome bd-type quinol oxidase subunit 1
LTGRETNLPSAQKEVVSSVSNNSIISCHGTDFLFSIILFGLVYLTLFVLFIYLLNKKIVHGPSLAEE